MVDSIGKAILSLRLSHAVMSHLRSAKISSGGLDLSERREMLL